VLGPSGDGLFEDAPQMAARCREKIALPLFAVVARAAVASEKEDRTLSIARSMASGLSHLASSQGNELIPLSNRRYPRDAHERDLLSRSTRRTGMILNVEELAALTHPPDGTLQVEGLDRESRKTRALPAHLRVGSGVLLGENRHRGVTMPVRLSVRERASHTIILGATGTGKTTLIANMVMQDLEAGHGLALVDPAGDLAHEIAGRMPSARIDDTTYLDPSDPRGLVPVNILAARTASERTVMSADLASIFRNYISSWGDQMHALLGASLAVILESVPHATLLDLRRALVDAQFRSELIARVVDEETLFYWRYIFPQAGGRATGPLLARLDTFLRPRPVRAIVAGSGKGLDIPALLDGGVLLARLPQGSLGEDNSHIIAGMLAAKINQAALARAEQGILQRRPFTLYLDESHLMASSSLASILAGGRQNALALVLCSQEWDQWRGAPDVANAAQANANTRICFRLGESDARRFADGFEGFASNDLTRLSVGQAIARIGGADCAFSLTTHASPAKRDEEEQTRREEVIRSSSVRYEFPAGAAEVVQTDAPSSREQGTQADRPVEPLPVRSVHPTQNKGGRGGPEHRYLQHLIARLGEERGFRAVVEESIAGGRIDVALYHGEQRSAWQVAISSSAEYEVGGIERCLAAGYAPVLILSTDRDHLASIEKACRRKFSAK